MASSHPGRQALAALDEILRQKPKADGHLFSEAAEGMAAFRDHLIESRRAQRRRQLERVNAIISVVLAGRFPLSPVPWAEIETARTWLVSVLDENSEQGNALFF